MRRTVRASAIVFSALIASGAAHAGLYPDCFDRSKPYEPTWLVLEPIDFGANDPSREQLAQFLRNSLELAASAAQSDLRARQIDASIWILDCGEKRRRRSDKVTIANLDDFDDTNVPNLLDKNIVTVVWGDASGTGGIRIQFAVLSRLLQKDLYPKAIAIPYPSAGAANLAQSVEDLKVVPLVGILARIDYVLYKIVNDGKFAAEAKKRCHLDNAKGALTWTESRLAGLAQGEANAWLRDWLGKVQVAYATVAQNKDLLCVK